MHPKTIQCYERRETTLLASRVKTILFSLTAIILAGSMMAFPKVSVDASLNGLKLWWNVVFPSLLPFFIVSEILIGLGVVSFIGVLLEPIMRPIFKVPGVGGFVFVMGLASGFPAGAKITSRLYQEGELTKTEAERLASFTNFSNPLFMFGAVAYGFFHQAALGMIFALSHYIGNIIVGLCMRFYKPLDTPSAEKPRSSNLVVEAFRKLHHERLRNKRPLGKMLGDAVSSSVTTLLMVGGFIILFSVLNQLLTTINITTMVASALSLFLHVIHLTPGLSQGIVPGLFEITIGAKTVSAIQAPLIEKVMVVCFILGFTGFSIQAQVASILAEVKLSFKPFFVGRLLHGVFSAVASLFLFKFLLTPSAVKKTITTLGEQTTHHIEQWGGAELLQIGSFITLLTLCLFIFLKAMRHLKENPR